MAPRSPARSSQREEVEAGTGGSFGEGEAKEGIGKGDGEAREDAHIDAGLAGAEGTAQLPGSLTGLHVGALAK